MEPAEKTDAKGEGSGSNTTSGKRESSGETGKEQAAAALELKAPSASLKHEEGQGKLSKPVDTF